MDQPNQIVAGPPLPEPDLYSLLPADDETNAEDGTKPNWRERRAEKKAAREDAKALAEWADEQQLLDALSAAAQAAAAGQSSAPSGNANLARGECALWAGSAALVEVRQQRGQYVSTGLGTSFRIAKGVRLHTGTTRGRYVPGDDAMTKIDSGEVVVTDRRAFFLGVKGTRVWDFSKLLGVQLQDGIVLMNVSNRQKTSGVLAGSGFVQYLKLGTLIKEVGATKAAAEVTQVAEEHRALMPETR